MYVYIYRNGVGLLAGPRANVPGDEYIYICVYFFVFVYLSKHIYM